MQRVNTFLLILLGTIIVGAGCKNTWSGFYYPEGCLTCTDRHIIKHDLTSFEECREWAEEISESRRYSENDDYECGLNCKTKDGFNICEQTVD